MVFSYNKHCQNYDTGIPANSSEFNHIIYTVIKNVVILWTLTKSKLNKLESLD